MVKQVVRGNIVRPEVRGPLPMMLAECPKRFQKGGNAGLVILEANTTDVKLAEAGTEAGRFSQEEKCYPAQLKGDRP